MLFPTQGLNPRLLRLCIGRHVLYQQRQRKPRILTDNPLNVLLKINIMKLNP